MTDIYYNENDPAAAQWLRNLMENDLIQKGYVDERSIEDVDASDLVGFRQCHFFAGIGGWSYALDLARYPRDEEVWTGSCPCPPFSVAGKGKECPECGGKHHMCHPRKTGHFICLSCGNDWFADARHLWPEFSRLIRECRPKRVFGEQVASKDGRTWLSAVSADLQNASYGVTGTDICAAGVGAPHIRQRLWFGAERLADSHGSEWWPQNNRRSVDDRQERERDQSSNWVRERGDTRGLADSDHAEEQRRGIQRPGESIGSGDGSARQRSEGLCPTGGVANAERRSAKSDGLQLGRAQGGNQKKDRQRERIRDESRSMLHTCGMANANDHGCKQGIEAASPSRYRDTTDADGGLPKRQSATSSINSPGGSADWLFCRDGKWRPVEPFSQRMADGISIALDVLRNTNQKIKRDLLDVAKTQEFGRQALQAMRFDYDKEALWIKVGGCIGFPAATLLFAILREYKRELGNVFNSEAQGSKANAGKDVQQVREHETTPSSSQRWEFSEQQCLEFGDALSKLSQESAPIRELVDQLALTTPGPLANGVSNRMVLLRGYGNAIVPQVAALFIEAHMEAASDVLDMRKERNPHG